MADSIIKCVSVYDANDNLLHRVVHYHLEYGNYQTNVTAFVGADEMTDPEDLDECKSIANIKAAAEKNRWLGSLAAPASKEEGSDLNGSVSL